MPYNGTGRWGRLRPVQLDPLDAYGLPSKGELRLHNFKNQESYYTKIIERYLAFCTEAKGRDGLLERFSSLELSEKEPGSSDAGASSGSGSGSGNGTVNKSATKRVKAAIMPTPAAVAGAGAGVTGTGPGTAQAHAAKDLSDVLMALRKLREAIVATKRADDFSVHAYLFCIRLAILIKQPDAYHPAILYLLRVMRLKHPLTSVETDEVVAYLVLDAACRRGDLAEAYRLRCAYHLRSPIVSAVLAALVRDDWVAFRRLQLRVDGHQAKLLECADGGLRMHTLKCFGRAYLRLGDVAYLESATGMKWPDLQDKCGVGWERDGEAVIIRKMKQKLPTGAA